VKRNASLLYASVKGSGSIVIATSHEPRASTESSLARSSPLAARHSAASILLITIAFDPPRSNTFPLTVTCFPAKGSSFSF
jgi:hypothetical protein